MDWSRIQKVLSWIFLTLLTLGIMAQLVAWLSGGDFLFSWKFMVVFGVVGLLYFAAYHIASSAREWKAIKEKQKAEDQRRAEEKAREEENDKKLLDEFALCKPVSDLVPEDFGYEVLPAGTRSDNVNNRPFYHEYVPRRMRLVSSNGHDAPAIFTESDLEAWLRSGKGFVLQGEPVLGKTRTLFQIVKQLHDWWIVIPRKYEPCPSRAAYERFLSGKNVVLFVDDLNDYVDTGVDWSRWTGTEGLGLANCWVGAVTCRDGAELSAVNENLGTPMSRFYEEFPFKLGVLPQTDHEKASLAAISGLTWDVARSYEYPTAGSIAMEGTLRLMRDRFERDLDGPQRDFLRAIQMLLLNGVYSLESERVESVWRNLYNRVDAHLGDTLDALARHSFLDPGTGSNNVRIKEVAYLLSDVVTQRGDSTSGEETAKLIDLFIQSGDVDGLTQLGWGLINADEPKLALDAFDNALTLLEHDSSTLIGRGLALRDMKRPEEALAAYEASLAVEPNHAGTLGLKGTILWDMKRPEEALAAYEASLAIEPNDVVTLSLKGAVLKDMKRPEEALAAYEASLAVEPNHATTLGLMGNALLDLERPEEALAAYEASLAVEPNDAGTLNSKGYALRQLKRPKEALAAYEASLVERPNDADTLYDKGIVLADLKRPKEALAAYEASLQIRPNDADVLHNRGNVLRDLKRPEEALVSYEASLKLRSNDADSLNGKGIVLADLKRPEEALAALEASLAERPNDAGTLNNKGNALRDLKRFEEALAAYEASLAIDPYNAVVLNNKGIALSDQKRFEEALAAYEASLEIDSNQPHIVKSVFVAYKALELRIQATQALRKLIALDQSSDECIVALLEMAEWLHINGRHQIGAKTNLRVLELAEQSGELSFLRIVFMHSYFFDNAERLEEDLRRLREILNVARAENVDWEYSASISRAIADGHPESNWLPMLAQVERGELPLSALDEWPAWNAAPE